MKKLGVILFILFPAAAISQTTFWTEDFGTGCDQGQLANAYTGTNGAWTIEDSGVNEEDANNWFVSATENGNPVGQCGSGCGNNRTLHISNTVHIDIPLLGINYPIDGKASYAEGQAGLCMPDFGLYCTVTSKRVQSPVINCGGKSDILVTFKYVHGGEGTSDNASILYSANGGTDWIPLGNIPKSQTCGDGTQGIWAEHSITLPSGANNNPNVRIGFNWVNNGNALGNDPSVAIDDITLSVEEVINCCDGDFNCDGVVNVQDMIIIVNQFGCTTGCTADLDNDGIISATDLTIFNGLYGDICP